MTKQEIVKKVATETGLTQAQAKVAVEQVLLAIRDGLVKDGRVELRDFGVFKTRICKARKRRNPRTGATVNCPARLAISFKAGKALVGVVSDLVSGADVEADEGIELLEV